MVKRDPTSLNIDSELWREVKKMAIDNGVTARVFRASIKGKAF